MASAIGSTFLDTFRTFGTAVAQTKVVKDIAKVTKGLIDAGVFGNAQLKDSAPKIIGAVDFLELGESLSYVAKWIDSSYIAKDGEVHPRGEKLKNNLAQVSLLVTRFFSFLKATDTYQLLTKADLRALGEKIPFVRDYLEKFPAFDTFAGAFFLPFGGVTFYDNTVSGVKGYKGITTEKAKVAKWKEKAAVAFASARNVENRRAAKIDLHTTKLKNHKAQLLKSGLGASSTAFKLVAASTAVVAALVFGGVAGVLTALVFLGLAGNTISLAKNFTEAYQDKYTRVYQSDVRKFSAAAAAA